MISARMREERISSDIVKVAGIRVGPAAKAAGFEATVGDEVYCFGIPRSDAKQSGSAED